MCVSPPLTQISFDSCICLCNPPSCSYSTFPLCVTHLKRQRLLARGMLYRKQAEECLAYGTGSGHGVSWDHPTWSFMFHCGQRDFKFTPLPLEWILDTATENHDTHNYTLWIFFVFFSWSIKSCKTLLIPHRMICVSEPTANVTDDCLWHQHWLLTLLQTDGIGLCMQLLFHLN